MFLPTTPCLQQVHPGATTSANATYSWFGSFTPLAAGTDYRHDWAVLLLDRSLGDSFGWMASRNVTPAPGDRVTLVGYSTDPRRPGGDSSR